MNTTLRKRTEAEPKERPSTEEPGPGVKHLGGRTRAARQKATGTQRRPSGRPSEHAAEQGLGLRRDPECHLQGTGRDRSSRWGALAEDFPNLSKIDKLKTLYGKCQRLDQDTAGSEMPDIGQHVVPRITSKCTVPAHHLPRASIQHRRPGNEGTETSPRVSVTEVPADSRPPGRSKAPQTTWHHFSSGPAGRGQWLKLRLYGALKGSKLT